MMTLEEKTAVATIKHASLDFTKNIEILAKLEAYKADNDKARINGEEPKWTSEDFLNLINK